MAPGVYSIGKGAPTSNEQPIERDYGDALFKASLGALAANVHGGRDYLMDFLEFKLNGGQPPPPSSTPIKSMPAGVYSVKEIDDSMPDSSVEWEDLGKWS